MELKREFKKYFLIMVDYRVKYISKMVTKKGARKNITKILNLNQKVLLKTVSGMGNLCSFGIMGRYPKKGVYKNGKRVGLWKFYNRNGVEITENESMTEAEIGVLGSDKKDKRVSE